MIHVVARIPSLAAHFGAPAKGPFNYETNMVPLVGMTLEGAQETVAGQMGKQHSSRVLKAIAKELGVSGMDKHTVFPFQPRLQIM